MTNFVFFEQTCYFSLSEIKHIGSLGDKFIVFDQKKKKKALRALHNIPFEYGSAPSRKKKKIFATLCRLFFSTLELFKD